MKIRYAKINEKSIIRKHWEDSFDDNENEIDFYFENIYNRKNNLILEENGEIISSLHQNPYIININSKEFKTKYIVGVSTLINYQKKGYMTLIIKKMLQDLKLKNFPLIFLTPINSDIYRRFGFEYFSRIEKYEFSIDLLENLETKKESVFYEITLGNFEKFIEDLIKIYNLSMKDNISFLKRDKFYFSKLLKECFNENMKIFIQYHMNVPTAYIIFSKYDAKIEIRECQTIKYEYYSIILKLLYGYKDYYKKIELYAQEKLNLEMIFKNQLEIKKSIFPFMMSRILNPIEVLNALNLKISDFKIYLKDDLLNDNTGIYYFDRNNNIWNFSKDISEDYTIKVNILNFASFLFGFYDLNEMIYMNKVEINKNLKEDKLLELTTYFKRKNSYLYEFQ